MKSIDNKLISGFQETLIREQYHNICSKLVEKACHFEQFEKIITKQFSRFPRKQGKIK